jgi:hypothetical protein
VSEGSALQSTVERRLLKFPELSGIGRVVEDGADEEEWRATLRGKLRRGAAEDLLIY